MHTYIYIYIYTHTTHTHIERERERERERKRKRETVTHTLGCVQKVSTVFCVQFSKEIYSYKLLNVCVLY